MGWYRHTGGETEASLLSSKTQAGFWGGKNAPREGRGGSCRLVLGTSPNLTKLLCLCSQFLLPPCCSESSRTTKAIASFVEAFNDSGASSSLGTVRTASIIPPSVAACSRNPWGAELTLAPQESGYWEAWSLLQLPLRPPSSSGQAGAGCFLAGRLANTPGIADGLQKGGCAAARDIGALS